MQEEKIAPTIYIDADYDAQMTLNNIIGRLPGEIQIKHVRGHQDDKKPGTKKLTWVEQLNIRAD
eukprot:10137316-Ditylum_brightwellii.AAC.1